MRLIGRSLLLVALSLYTAFAAGPFVWTAMMSLRTTTEIHLNHFAFPDPVHWEEVPGGLVPLQLRRLLRPIRRRSCWPPS